MASSSRPPEDVEKEFFRACKNSQRETVERLAREHPGLLQLFKQGHSPIGYVCLNANYGSPHDYVDVVRLLCSRGCDVNARENDGCLTALHLAANANDSPVQEQLVRLLIQYGADPGARETLDNTTPLQQLPRPPAQVAAIINDADAIRRGWEEEMARQEPGPEVGAQAVLHEDLFAGMGPAKALLQAIKCGREDAVMAAIADGGQGMLNDQGTCTSQFCPVDYACALAAFASPAPPGSDEARVRRAEYWADPANSCAIVRLLLAAGADPNRRINDGCQPAVLWAAQSNDHDLVILLLAYGANPNLQDMDGISAASEAQNGGDAGGHHNALLLEIIQAAAEIRERFRATGRVEWPIARDATAPVAAVPAAATLSRVSTAYQPAVQRREDFPARMDRIRREFLRISVDEGGRSTERARLVYEQGVHCEFGLPPTINDVRSEPNHAEHNSYLADRAAFVQEAMTALRAEDPRRIRDATLSVKFTGQQGLDWGGLTKIYINMMAECLFDPALPGICSPPLWTVMDETDNCEGFPAVKGLRRLRPDCVIMQSPRWRERLQFVGQFIGYCFWQGDLAEVPLVPSIWAYLLKNEIYWRDLCLDQPNLYQRSICQLLDYDAETIAAVCYTMEWASDEVPDPVPLVPGGADIDLTVENVREYVEQVALFEMRGRCRNGLEAVREGFESIVPAEMLSADGLLGRESLLPCEMQLMVCGTPEIDIDELQNRARYSNCRMGDTLCRWFFEVLRGWAAGNSMTGPRQLEQDPGPHLVSKVVEFATGSPRSPPCGWQNVRNKKGEKQPFCIVKLDEAPDRAPRAHTCFNKIDLVQYSSREKLAELLHVAIIYGMNVQDQ
eukprot:SAG31_NODE_3103_length_4672_cov_2.447409_1_plen_846_part_00